jgi:Domain of unknown function (DUF4296)
VKFSLKTSYFLLIGVLSTACTSQIAIPDDVISPNKMVEVIADLHLSEAKVSKLNLAGYDSSFVAYKELEKRIFNDHEIDSTKYKRSYNFYAMNPRYMVELYQKVEKKVKADSVKLR